MDRIFPPPFESTSKQIESIETEERPVSKLIGFLGIPWSILFDLALLPPFIIEDIMRGGK